MKRKLILITSLLLLILSIVFSDIYFLAYKELVEIFLTYFLPALFPSVFLILIIYNNIGMDSLYEHHPRIAHIVELLLACFGGTLVSNEIIKSMQFSNTKDKTLCASILSGSSFTFFFFIFATTNKALGFIYAFIYLLLKFFIAFFLIKYKHVKTGFRDTTVKFQLHRTFVVFFNMIISMFLVTLIVPILRLSFVSPLSDFFLGLVEFSRASKTLASANSILSMTLAVFILEFNGLTSLIQIKNSHPEVGIVRLITYKFCLGLVYSAIFYLLFLP